MTHLWVRAEPRENEERVGVMPEGVAQLIAAGIRVTVENSRQRAIPIEGFRAAGAEIAAEGAWVEAPEDAIIFGLKELPDDGTPLRHRHIMFGHAFKGQHGADAFLQRFRTGGGTLYDLEYLENEEGRRVAAFGYWAGYAGAAVSLLAWAAQQRGEVCAPVSVFASAPAMQDQVEAALKASGVKRPTALIIGALGRVGHGAADLCEALGIVPTRWDMAETANGGPFPEVLAHDVLFNCILARPGTPVFVPPEAGALSRRLTVIGDIACDPGSDYNPVPVYDAATDWTSPVTRVHGTPPLDVMAIDNLPSLLPAEASEDFAKQLLPTLLQLGNIDSGVWARAKATFDHHMKRTEQ